MHRLQATRSVDMGHGRNQRPFVRAHLEHLHHEGYVIVLLEPAADVLAQDRWCKGAKRFASLYLEIEHVFHIASPRIAKDGSVTQGARSPFHATLKPSNDKAIGDVHGNA